MSIDQKAFEIMVKRAGVKPELISTVRRFLREYEAAKAKEQPVDIRSAIGKAFEECPHPNDSGVADSWHYFTEGWKAAWSDGYNRGLEVEPIERESVTLDDAKLPCDVHIGGIKFGKGVNLSTFVNAARRWYMGAQQAFMNEHCVDVEAAKKALELTELSDEEKRRLKLDACDCWMLGADNYAHCKKCNPTDIEGQS